MYHIGGSSSEERRKKINITGYKSYRSKCLSHGTRVDPRIHEGSEIIDLLVTGTSPSLSTPSEFPKFLADGGLQ